MRYDTKRICATNSLFDWLLKYGIEPNRKGFAKCPFHEEKTASFRVYKDGTYHCFGCGAHGDVITFVMNMQKLSFTEVCEMLDRDINYSEQRKIEHTKRQYYEKINSIRSAIINYWNAFDEWRENEEIIQIFRPSGPDAEPNSIFLHALTQRSLLEHELNIAENKRERRVINA